MSDAGEARDGTAPAPGAPAATSPVAPAPPAPPGPAPQPIISLKNVVKRFGSQTVLSGVTLDIYPGEIVVIMGGSGSGKSTLLRLIIGSMKPDEGEIRLFGEDICDASPTQLDEIRKRFGILFQSGALFNAMSLADNVALPIREHTDLDEEIIDIQVKIKLELVGLLEHAAKLPGQISGGMKKRAGLARALALDPEILFYDEPSAGLDPVTSAQIDQLILALTKQLGVTSVVVTHEMDSAFTIADRMAMLDRGRMLRVDTREWFDTLRRMDDAAAADRPINERLIRQFLRGDAEGPITQRRDSSLLERALFGDDYVVMPMPSLEPTRRARGV
jgi:phospholipid/cholesterol/gamma-HCH transport system ATP-binding protein